MRGVEDEPLPKRMKVSSGNIGGLSDGISVGEQGSCSLGGSMALQLASGDDKVVGSNGLISKVEFVRIITEALYSLGYSKIGKHLEEELGIPLHSNLVATFIQQILDGQWDESFTTLHQIDLIDESIIKTASFMILERKFFELLDGEKEVDALNTLRTQIIPLNVNRDRAHELSYFMVCPSKISLDKTHSQESGLCSRKKFLGELQKLLPPTVVPQLSWGNVIARGPLVWIGPDSLSNCAVYDFKMRWYFSTINVYASLYCSAMAPQSTNIIPLAENNGLKKITETLGIFLLAPDVKGSYVNVDGHVIMRHRLTGHGQPVSCVSWSPEDDQILTCGEDKTVRRWDIDSGECLCVYGKQNLGLVSCEWAADGKHIFTGVTDKSIRMWDLEGKEVDFCQGKTAYHMENLGITTDGKELIIHCKDDGVFFVWMGNSLWDGDLHLWNIDGWLQNIGEYIGNKRSSLVVRSCLGGLKQAFVASGSENSQVYIWHRHYVRPIFSLSGHTGAVNCVSWNPANHHMLASASNDRTIRIWGPKQVNS
ncbi:hypothetical protein SASPL_152222 [Salvia splendens]|uniref:CTLH domain-containing protein n=1 Tax=Salvia splendens TaxID=180675 RepID=A0A8X8W2V5_SALSN|nr:hypothetical protein SASPL_152222 [Salvia splendens]